MQPDGQINCEPGAGVVKYTFIVVILWGMFAVGCVADQTDREVLEEVSEEIRVCIPNITQECLCLGGISGVQSCSSDGLGWEVCACPDVQNDPDTDTVSDTGSDMNEDVFDGSEYDTEEIFEDSAEDIETDTEQEAPSDVPDDSVEETDISEEDVIEDTEPDREAYPESEDDSEPEDSSDDNSSGDDSVEEADVSEEELIEPACTDLDGDSYYGQGDDCDPLAENWDCDEERDYVYLGAAELCDEIDNDCDIEIDEDYDFMTDAAHCGDCFTECSENQLCCEGECVSINVDSSNCGGCGVLCSSGGECISGLCSCVRGFCSADETCRNGECCSDNGKCFSPVIKIPAGPFMMGCNSPADEDCEGIEEPYHQVSVPEFKIDVTEVTVAQYRACVDNNADCSEPSTEFDNCNWNYSDREEHPVTCISWTQASEYCEWVGKRLCSESEWEKAARGLDGRIYPWGNEEATCDRAVMISGEEIYGCGEDRTWQVGSRPAGMHGLYDMAGNVIEWVEDDWHQNYEGAPTDGSAWTDTPIRSLFRMLRGGTYQNRAMRLRTSYRGAGDPTGFHIHIGARCCGDI